MNLDHRLTFFWRLVECHTDKKTLIQLYIVRFSDLAISAGKKRSKSTNFNKIRLHYRQDTLREQIIPDESNRFRYFYHIRRAHGDALSSVSFIIDN